MIFIIALILRIIFACTLQGFESDISCFFSWARMLAENGFSGFYSPDYFCDYPPGYLYILRILGGIFKTFELNSLTPLSRLITKSPAILCDLGIGYLLYAQTQKKFTKRTAAILAACYLFHPAVLINSSIWGQVDSVFTFAILVTCILLTQKKYLPAYFIYAIALLIKPQALFFAPLILCAVAEYSFQTKSIKKIFLHLSGGLTAILSMFILSLPFGFENVFRQYTDTLGSYAYAAVNACNLWGLFGLNWVSQENTVGLLTYAQIGTISIVLATIFAFLLFYFLRNREDRYYLTGTLLVVFVFIFAVRMHERYMYPAMILLLFAYVHNRESGYLLHYITLSLCHFGNVYYVLYYYDPYNYDRKSFPLISISLLTVISGIYFFISLIQTSKGIKASVPFSINKLKIKGIPLRQEPEASQTSLRFTKWDIAAILSICIFYGAIAFTNLGIMHTPQTEQPFPYYTYLELESVDDAPITQMYWYLLNEQDVTCSLEIKETPSSDWVYVQDITLHRVFKWDVFELPTPATGIRLTNTTKDTNIGELVFTDNAGNQVAMKQAQSYYPLFDEADIFPGSVSPLTGSYFDEIYYTRTIYEFLHGLPTYENTHPPFGKVLIMLGTLLFSTSPFGFRFMGTLFGVLMLPFLYLLGRNISKNRVIGFFAAFIFAFDFMHFVQTRITTIDVFITFFVILMYYFMERYLSYSFYDTSLKKTWIPLGACGIAFGFGVASKWTGAYAGAGLALLFFLQLFRRYQEYRYALANPKGKTGNIKHSYIIQHFREYTLKTIGFCMIFFVAIPFVIYLLSYIPFVDSSHPGLLERMLANQSTMYNYHSKLEATHPYSSHWYEWPTMIRPIFYYSGTLAGNVRLGISSFGNPLVWWLGIPAGLYTLYKAVIHREKTAVLLSIGYLAMYCPWFLVDRCTFIYHYFPCTPFVVLMIIYSFLGIQKRLSKKNSYILLAAYALSCFVLFIIFYPVLAGTPVTTDYVNDYLRWMNSWVLIIN